MKTFSFATTAMAIMPHTDVDAALDLAFSLDVPFWPQLPHLSFGEDMYVQSLAGFPGVSIDSDSRRIAFSKADFIAGLDAYLTPTGEPAVPPAPSPAAQSATYDAFLARDLTSRPAIRGQVMGPISCGFRLIDQDKKPVIYDDEVRPLLLDHVAREANTQIRALFAHNSNVFVFMDEPGLGMVFSGLSGYSETRADMDLRALLDAVEGDVAIHLCGRPDWDFLLRLPIAMLSFNAFAGGKVFVAQTERISAFLKRGGIICWGIVPTHEAMLDRVSVEFLAEQLGALFEILVQGGIDRRRLAEQSMLAPATCNLAGTPASVERAFTLLRELAEVMRTEWTES